jgi:hypothetical protein
MATTDLHFVHGALTPVKRGIRFLGGNVDDGIQVDAAAVAIVAGNHTKGTFACWFMVPDITGTYTLFGTGDANAVEYTEFRLEAGTINVMMVKAGPTTQLDVNTPANSYTPHKWYHLAIVQDASRMKIYINGVEQTLTWTTETDPAQWFDDLNNIDGAHIGASDSVAGGGALTNEFKGYISDVLLYSGTASTDALTKLQVEKVMSGASHGSPHNYWKLQEDLIDSGSGADNGTAVGDIIFSSANEFASRLTFLETVPLAADNVTIMSNDGVGYAYSILAA